MPVITIFSSGFCNEASVIEQIIARTDYRQITDEQIVAEASRRYGIPESKLKRAFSNETSVFNKFTHEKERSIAYIKRVVAQKVAMENVLLTGFSGQLIPRSITHVLRTCLVAPFKHRIENASRLKAVSEKEAAKRVHQKEEDCTFWMHTICQTHNPWDPALYDIVIPADRTPTQDAVDLVAQHVDSAAVKVTPESKQALENFCLAAEAEAVLASQGHRIDAEADRGAVTLTIQQQVLMLNRLQEELKSIVGAIPEVESIEIKIDPNSRKMDIYRKYDVQRPSKILLVDDEREFVQTLSERLNLRDMGSVTAYDGESALELIQKDDPEVMIVDLKMPGIDGFSVLRKVKETRPDIEVIILTGHGNDADGKKCMQMGAFAYLQKPLDINQLSETIQAANQKIQHQKATGEGPK